MSDSFSSDEDLPDPSDLLDRLLLETPRKGLINNGSINNPLNHRAFDPKLPESVVRTPLKLGEGTGRRSSPRLRDQRGSSTNSLFPSNARASTSKRAESPSFDSERERDIHLELATKLFPPSPRPAPAPQPPRSTAPPFLPEQILRRMSVGSIVEDSDIEAEREESYRIDRDGREKRQDEISQRKRDDEGRGVREGTVISDSEIEGEERIPASALETPRRRKPRVSATFDLEESETEGNQNDETVTRRDTERITRDPLVDSLNRLNLAISSIPKPAPSSLSTRSRSRSPTKPSVPYPLPLPTSTKSTRNLDTPRRSTSKRIGQKSARGKRRITISVISSSSSESSDSSKEDETEEGILRRSTPPRLDRKDPAPARGTRRNGLGGRVTTVVEEEEGEIIMVETDDEEETGIQGGGRDGGEEEILPVLEPSVKLNGVQGIGEEGGGYGYRGMDDVWENDGVLIYDPTPKKRPAKLSSTLSKPSPSPFLHAHPTSTPVPRNRALTPSKLRTEETIDLTLSPTKRNHSKPSHRSKPDSPALYPTPRNETSQGKKPQQANKKVEIDLTESSSEEEEAARDKDEYYLPPPSKFFTTPGPMTPRTTATKSRSTSPSKSSIPAPPARTPRTPNPKPKPKDTPRPTPSSSSSALLTPSDRTSLPLSLIRQLDKQVFRKTWVSDLECLDQRHEDEKEGEGVKGLPEGLEVVWNARLRNTAGRAKWKKVKSPNPNGSMTLRHECTIELATKVTDTVEKLRNTLAHELCHIAAWVLSGEIKPPHGNAFKLWATRIMKVCPDIKVTTTHSYEIVYKYRWKCSSTVCGKIFGRHSNSINVETHGCPCGSKLSQIDKDGNVKKPMIPKMILQENERGEMVETPVRRKKSDWLEFVATQSPRVRKEKPEIPQSEVLKVVAERWKVAKEEMARAKLRELEKDKDKALKDNRDGNELERAMSGLKV